MKVSNKIPEVSFFKFLKHANAILQNPLPFHAKNFDALGDIFRLKIGFGKSVLFCRDAGLLQHALQKNQKNYTKSYIQTKDLVKYVGKGLLTAEGEHWQKQRQMIGEAQASMGLKDCCRHRQAVFLCLGSPRSAWEI